VSIQSIPFLLDPRFARPLVPASLQREVCAVGLAWTLDLGKRTRSGHEVHSSRAPGPQQLLAAGPGALDCSTRRAHAVPPQAAWHPGTNQDAPHLWALTQVRQANLGGQANVRARHRHAQARKHGQAHQDPRFPCAHPPDDHFSLITRRRPNSPREHSIAATGRNTVDARPRRSTAHHHGAVPLLLALLLIYKSFFSPPRQTPHARRPYLFATVYALNSNSAPINLHPALDIAHSLRPRSGLLSLPDDSSTPQRPIFASTLPILL